MVTQSLTYVVDDELIGILINYRVFCLCNNIINF